LGANVNQLKGRVITLTSTDYAKIVRSFFVKLKAYIFEDLERGRVLVPLLAAGDAEPAL
jgi:hypothetical protein